MNEMNTALVEEIVAFRAYRKVVAGALGLDPSALAEDVANRIKALITERAALLAPVDAVNLEEVLRLDREGTAGPWLRAGDHSEGFDVLADGVVETADGPLAPPPHEVCTAPGFSSYRVGAPWPKNAALIAYYRTAAPASVREIARLRAELRWHETMNGTRAEQEAEMAEDEAAEAEMTQARAELTDEQIDAEMVAIGLDPTAVRKEAEVASRLIVRSLRSTAEVERLTAEVSRLDAACSSALCMLAEGPDAIGVAEAVRQAMAILRERKQVNNQEDGS